MALYTEILKEFEKDFKEAGLSDVPSPWIAKHGNTPIDDELLAYKPDLKKMILDGELSNRRNVIEYNRLQQAQQKKELIDIKLAMEIQKRLPEKAELKQQFQHLHESCLKFAVSETRKLADFDISPDGELIVAEAHPQNKEPKSELDKLLRSANISRYQSEYERSVDGLIESGIESAGTNKLFSNFI